MIRRITKIIESNYRPFSSFTIGLALWFVAEMSWTYYELGLGIKNPYPSVADAIWLGGIHSLFILHIGQTISFPNKMQFMTGNS